MVAGRKESSSSFVLTIFKTNSCCFNLSWKRLDFKLRLINPASCSNPSYISQTLSIFA